MTSFSPEWSSPHLAQRPPRRGWPAWKIVTVALVPLAVTVGVAAIVTGGDDVESVDPQDAAACSSFRAAAADYREGVLTLGELRVRFQGVSDDARGATGPVAKASREMLAAITSNVAELPAAIEAMDSACDAAQ